MKGQITISRVHSHQEQDYVSIRFNDETNGAEFLDAKMSLGSFADALLGLARVYCEFELRPQHVGKRREIKTEIVTVSSYSPTPEQKAAALAPFEVDGWVGRQSDLGNHHCAAGVSTRIGEYAYRVSFVRFVEDK